MDELLVLQSDSDSNMKLIIEYGTGLIELVDADNTLLAEFWLPEGMAQRMR